MEKLRIADQRMTLPPQHRLCRIPQQGRSLRLHPLGHDTRRELVALLDHATDAVGISPRLDAVHHHAAHRDHAIPA
ncbi:hypothetical protein D9M68_973770 [compost metagenome]